jgi:hypothetical protein
MSALSLRMWQFVCAWRLACGSDFGGWDICRDPMDGERVLVILDRHGDWLTTAAVEWGDTFHHPKSPYYVGTEK